MTGYENTQRAHLPAPTDRLPARRFTGSDGYTGPVLAHISCPNGTVRVSVDPAAEVARVQVRTDQVSGPIAEAVKNTTIRQQAERLTVTVPPAPTAPQHFGGSTYNFHGGVHISGSTFSSVTTDGGTTFIGGAGRTGKSTTGVEVLITLPFGSGVQYDGDNGSLHVHGVLAALRAQAVNGSIHAETVGRIKAEAANGSIKVDTVTEWIDAEADNGSVKVANHAGSAARVRADNGAIVMTVAPSAAGRIEAQAHNGSVKLHGIRHRNDMDVRAAATNGIVREY